MYHYQIQYVDNSWQFLLWFLNFSSQNRQEFIQTFLKIRVCWNSAWACSLFVLISDKNRDLVSYKRVSFKKNVIVLLTDQAWGEVLDCMSWFKACFQSMGALVAVHRLLLQVIDRKNLWPTLQLNGDLAALS